MAMLLASPRALSSPSRLILDSSYKDTLHRYELRGNCCLAMHFQMTSLKAPEAVYSSRARSDTE